MLQRLLLGPQRPITNLDKVVADASIPDGAIAVISTGWQEAEGDIDDVRALVPRTLIDLNLYHRAEQVFAADENLRSAYRQRQEELMTLQRLYRLRLRQLMIAARQLRRSDAPKEMVVAEQRHAISQIRALDQHHLNRIEAIHESYDERLCIRPSTPLAEHLAEIKATLDACETILITGGNVIVLMNRLRLFGVDQLLAEKHLVAWSAGAMVLADQIVLYHDKTPQGRRDAEVFSSGTGVLPGYVFLPDTRRRLKHTDSIRVGIFSQRFAPVACVTLDSGSVLQFQGTTLRRAEDVKSLSERGGLKELRPV